MAKAINYEVLDYKLSHLFKPSAPIDKDNLFCGRKTQVR